MVKQNTGLAEVTEQDILDILIETNALKVQIEAQRDALLYLMDAVGPLIRRAPATEQFAKAREKLNG